MRKEKHTPMALQIRINGIVQGVGFRPFLYSLATRLRIQGWVKNRNDGVLLHAQGDPEVLQDFLDLILKEQPVAARIDSLETSPVAAINLSKFSIDESQTLAAAFTGISPDIAPCADCLDDLNSQPHRIHYPLINCTHCGPRYTIIQNLPYDRQVTSMKDFPMCDTCKSEYQDVFNRRFHAQPVACNHCGPQYALEIPGSAIRALEAILETVCHILQAEGIIALKATGGYNLLCDAQSGAAVKKIREIKGREGKPFAVMFGDVAQVRDYCWLEPDVEALLTSWRRPVVLLRQHHNLAASINPGLDTLGVMLPNFAFYHILFNRLQIPALVCTSANRSGEPIIGDDNTVMQAFSHLVDGLVYHPRKIINPIDDSVCQVVNQVPQLIRRARGYVPEAIKLPMLAEGIMATGSDMKSTFALGRQSQAILSPYFGDLDDYDVLERYRATMDRFQTLFGFKTRGIVADLHPAYHATLLARQWAAESGVPIMLVQHHHAHIASCMAEHQLDESVIGVCFDGTGYGDDGHAWGSEFMVCDYSDYSRYAHFAYIPLAGGDQAIREPWRIALAMMRQISRIEASKSLESIPVENRETVLQMLAHDLNCPLSCGAGRLFDAVAALLGLCMKTSFDGEGPMLLESLCIENETGDYDFGQENIIDIYNVIDQVMGDIERQIPPPIIATCFHRGMARLIVQKVGEIHQATGISKVVLSGGVFHNRFLLRNVINGLKNKGLDIYLNEKVPPNDGGLALGQLAIAARKWSNICV